MRTSIPQLKKHINSAHMPIEILPADKQREVYLKAQLHSARVIMLDLWDILTDEQKGSICDPMYESFHEHMQDKKVQEKKKLDAQKG